MGTNIKFLRPLIDGLRVFQGRATLPLIALLISVGLHVLMFVVIPSSRSKTAEMEVIKIGVLPKRKGDVYLSSQKTEEAEIQIKGEDSPKMTKPQRRRDLSARPATWRAEKASKEKKSVGLAMMANLQTTGIQVNLADSQGEFGKVRQPDTTNAEGSSASEPGGEPVNWSDGSDGLSSLRKSYAMLVRKMLEERQSYPAAAIEQEIEGKVRVVIEIGKDGSVLSARLAVSSGHAELDKAILSSIKGMGKLPEPPGGPIVISIPMVFRLEEDRF